MRERTWKWVKDHLKGPGQAGEPDQVCDGSSGHDRRYAIDPTQMETELGSEPQYVFDTGMEYYRVVSGQ